MKAFDMDMTADQMFAAIGYDKSEMLDDGVKGYYYGHFPDGMLPSILIRMEKWSSITS